MFDFHTHILPGLDDGSRDIEESISMLNTLKLQGVEGVAATPHFYADYMSPDLFFELRRSAWERLKPCLKSDLPEIRLGAEVHYFEGIDQYAELSRFCIEGTELLLLEMPRTAWPKRMVASLAEMSRRKDIVVLLAHIERYLSDQHRETWDFLLNCGICMQVSASFFANRHTRRKAIKLLREEKIHVLGTDCHNMTSRRPNMSDAVTVIHKKKCEAFLRNMEAQTNILLQQSVVLSNEPLYAAKIGDS